MMMMIETMTAVQITAPLSAGVTDVVNDVRRRRTGEVVPLLAVIPPATGLPRGSGASGPPRRAIRARGVVSDTPGALPRAQGCTPRVITQALETTDAVTRVRSGWVAPARPTRGVTVCGPDGAYIGVLTAIRSQGVVVARPLRPAVDVPLAAIATVRDEQLTLTVTAAQVERMPWRHTDDSGVPDASDRSTANAAGRRARR